jgi:hypothetical protein
MDKGSVISSIELVAMIAAIAGLARVGLVVRLEVAASAAVKVLYPTGDGKPLGHSPA